MKRILLILVFFGLALGLTGCGEDGRYQAMGIFYGDHQLSPGEVMPGAVLMFDGRLEVPEGARLRGPVIQFGGELNLNGTVEDDVSLFSGGLRLGPQARVSGALVHGGGALDVNPGAQVAEGVVVGGGGMEMPVRPRFRSELATWPMWLAFSSGLALLAYLALHFRPHPIWRLAQVTGEYPAVSVSLGILMVIVLPTLLVLMSLTLILIPVVVLLGGFFLIAIGLTWVAFGFRLGRYLVRHFHLGWSPPVASASGAFVFVWLVYLLGFIPFLGGVVQLVLVAAGLGALLLTRGGLRKYAPPVNFEPDHWEPQILDQGQPAE